MSELRIPVEVAGIQQICKRLHMPTIAAQCARLAEQAIKEKQSHLIYLEMLLEAEVEERERNVMERRLKEARFPKVKTLEEFNFEVAPHLPATGLRKLAEGQYIEKTEPLVFIGDTGTGKTHLATALGRAEPWGFRAHPMPMILNPENGATANQTTECLGYLAASARVNGVNEMAVGN